jgi:hypothetical protein
MESYIECWEEFLKEKCQEKHKLINANITCYCYVAKMKEEFLGSCHI